MKVIIRQRGEQLVTRLVNDTLAPVSGKVEYGWWRLDGSSREVQSRDVQVPANGMIEVASEKVPSSDQRDPSQWLYASVLKKDGIAVDQSVWLLTPYRRLAASSPQIKAASTADGFLEVSSPVYAHAVHLEDHGHELISNNWFDLCPACRCAFVFAGSQAEQVHLEAVTPTHK